ncbi:MAG: hypothetical protein PHV61_07115, partial [Limnochordia bacterium]|nr:hypothetical protein [Limnochordia bacterium]MDD4519182.1 hypothetical protein [Limnochordia bacterium]
IPYKERNPCRQDFSFRALRKKSSFTLWVKELKLQRLVSASFLGIALPAVDWPVTTGLKWYLSFCAT